MSLKKTTEILQNLGIHIFSFDESFKDTVTMSIDDLDDLDVVTMSKYIYILAQYITYLFQQRNFIKIKEEQLQKKYEAVLASLIPQQQAKTLKEKRMLAANTQEAQEIEKQLNEVMALRKSLENIPEGYIEILNALKRYHETLLKLGGKI